MTHAARIAAKLLLAAVFCLPVPAATIILVRHAERSGAMSADPPLTSAGEERAKVLAQVLKDSGIDRIYVTELRRTQQTAEPVAARLHLKPIVVAAKDTDALLTQLRELSDDQTVLVIGHSNTLPLIVDRLGGGSIPPMPETEYDRLIVLVTSPSGGKAHVVTLRYGTATN